MKEIFLIIKINDIADKMKEKGWGYQWQTQNHLTCEPQTH